MTAAQIMALAKAYARQPDHRLLYGLTFEEYRLFRLVLRELRRATPVPATERARLKRIFDRDQKGLSA